MKKKLLFFFFAVLLFFVIATPAYAKTTNWTNGAATRDFTATGNWSNGVPVTSDTIQFLDSTAALPILHLPNAGEVFALVFGDVTVGDFVATLTDLLGSGNWDYSSLSASNCHLTLDKDSIEGGEIIVIDFGWIYPTTNITNATVTMDSSGNVDCLVNIAFEQKITVLPYGILYSGPGTIIVLNGGIDLAGELQLADGSSFDLVSPVVCTGSCAIDWAFGGVAGTVYGGLNADGYTVIHTYTTGATLTVDQAGILDLGTANNTVAGLTVNLSATTHLNKNWSMAGMTVGLGSATIIADADLAINGASATSISATAAVINANGHVVTVSNLGDKAVTCYGCTDGGGNGSSVVFISADATLSNLAISSGTLTPTFASGTTSYTATVACSTASITATPTANQANATITVNGTAVDSGSASGAASLSVGSNTITTVVTAQDGTTTATYTITVTRTGCGGLPPQGHQPPIAPAAGFKITINNNDSSTNTRAVTLQIQGGPDTASMLISNSPAFTGVAQEPYQTTKQWTLSSGNGTKTVYARFYTAWGQSSEPVSDTIILTGQTQTIQPETTTEEAIAAKIAEIKQQLIALIAQLIQMLQQQILLMQK